MRKIFIDYFFFQTDQWDCTKSLSIFNRFASSEQLFSTFIAKFVACQFRTRGLAVSAWDDLLTSEILRDTGRSWETTQAKLFPSSLGFSPLMILFCLLGLALS